jgi:glycerol-3-phosphate dehydrogenase (NAD(P)+)
MMAGQSKAPSTLFAGAHRMATVAIVGAGYMGTATAYPLTDNGHTVHLIGTHLDDEIIQSCRERHYHPKLRRELPSGVKPYFVSEIAQALQGVDIVVSGVNSLGVRWMGRAVGPYLRAGQVLVAVTKGLEVAENGDLVILPDVLETELPQAVRAQVKIAAIGGPCIAGELAGRRESSVMFGSRDEQTAPYLAEVFRTSYYHVRATTDLVGLEVCAALKNAYALAVGLTKGLLEWAGGQDEAGAQMHNLAAATFAQGCVEMDRVLQIVRGTRAFAVGLPGAGDLYVTCQGGRNVRLGQLLGKGYSLAEALEIMAESTLEGAEIVRVFAEALPKLEARGLIGPTELPLMRLLADVIVRGQPVDLSVGGLFGDSVGQA